MNDKESQQSSETTAAAKLPFQNLSVLGGKGSCIPLPAGQISPLDETPGTIEWQLTHEKSEPQLESHSPQSEQFFSIISSPSTSQSPELLERSMELRNEQRRSEDYGRTSNSQSSDKDFPLFNKSVHRTSSASIGMDRHSVTKGKKSYLRSITRSTQSSLQEYEPDERSIHSFGIDLFLLNYMQTLETTWPLSSENLISARDMLAHFLTLFLKRRTRALINCRNLNPLLPWGKRCNRALMIFPHV